MNMRKLAVSLITAGGLSVGLGSSLSPAFGEESVCEVHLEGGKTVTVHVSGSCSKGNVGGLVNGVIKSVDDVTPSDDNSSDDSDNQQPEQPPQDQNTQPSGNANQGSSGNQSTQPTQTTPPPPATPTAPAPPARRPANASPRRAATAPATHVETQRRKPPTRHQNGAPTADNPTFSFSVPGPAQIGVPNFFIEKFRIPPFLLSIYQAAGTEYDVPWQVLASINEIESDYGRNLSVSSAGAMGWMQFIPSSWKAYGVDANNDGLKDPYNPVDAIFAAARYLRAAGANKDLRQAIFAYNHADWYVDSVMLRAKLIGGLPDDLIGAITGLTQGHFPVAARATYADDVRERSPILLGGGAKRLQARNATRSATVSVQSSPTRRGINIYSARGAPVIAVNDGVITRMGRNKQLGNFIEMRDVYGNTYTYALLGRVAPSYPTPKPRPVSALEIRQTMEAPPREPAPKQPASGGRQPAAPPNKLSTAPRASSAASVMVAKERLFASPGRPNSYRAGGEQQMLEAGKPVAGYTTFQAYFKQVLGLDREDVVLRKMRPGAQVIAGTILGRIDKVRPTQAPHVYFAIHPAGKGAPAIDPKPVLDGWKLLESTAIYRAAGKNPFFGPDARNPSIGQILLLSKEALERRVLADPRISVYDCGRRDLQAGQIDRRVLATIEFLTASGLKPTITSLKCGHSFYTKAGGVSEHSSGNAVDIAAINGIPIIGHQGPGSITEITIRRLLTLQGIMKPHQIISLMTFAGASNTMSLSDHDDHIHVGFQPLFDPNGKLGEQFNAVLKPNQWVKLIDRLNEIDNPVVPVRPSKAAIPVPTSSRAHRGE